MYQDSVLLLAPSSVKQECYKFANHGGRPLYAFVFFSTVSCPIFALSRTRTSALTCVGVWKEEGEENSPFCSADTFPYDKLQLVRSVGLHLARRIAQH